MTQPTGKIPFTQPPEKWLKHNILATIMAFIGLHKRTYILAISCLLTIGFIDISVPWLVGKGIDEVRAGNMGSDGLWGLFALLVGLGFAMYVLRYIWRLALFSTSYRLSVNLRNYLYKRLSKLGPMFFQNYRTGDLMARATNDVDNIEMTVGEAVLAAFDGLLTLILVVAFMVIAIDWRLALVSLIPFPIMTYVFRELGNRIHSAFTTALDRFSDLNDHTQQSLAGLKPMRALGLQHVLKADFDTLTQQAKDANMKVARIDALFDPLVLAALGASTLLSLLMGSWLIANDELTLGQLTSFYLYLGFLIWPMFAFGWFLNLYHRGSAAHDRLHELINIPDTITDEGTLHKPQAINLAVEIKAFHYKHAQQPVLKDIHFELEHGKTLGIVGPTGAGKTTLLRLIQRHYESNQNEILINQKSIQDYQLQAVRDIFAMVPQDPILFSNTLKGNIALGAPSSNDDLIWQFVKRAQLEQDITQLPHGLDTIVGEKGVTLSGGQRQRIALARALMRNASILCLDDTLSAVDAETEQQLLATLKLEKGQRSIIIVAHRLSAVKDADHIIVLNHGEILEQGTHATLLATKGWYSQMYAHQQLESDLE